MRVDMASTHHPVQDIDDGTMRHATTRGTAKVLASEPSRSCLGDGHICKGPGQGLHHQPIQAPRAGDVLPVERDDNSVGVNLEAWWGRRMQSGG